MTAETRSEEAPFTHLFAEWQLAWALARACDRAHKGYASAIWNRPVIRAVGGKDAKQSLNDLYGQVAEPLLLHEKALPSTGATSYGIDEERYKTLVGLVPDFRIETADHSLLVILEAKTKASTPPVKKPLKEQLYLQFLESSTVVGPERKGFFYVVPEKASDGYARLLEHKIGSSTEFRAGVISWEDLLPLIGDDLIKMGLGALLEVAKGLQHLREWQERKVSKGPMIDHEPPRTART